MGIICRFDIVWKLRDQRKLVLFFTLNYVLRLKLRIPLATVAIIINKIRKNVDKIDTKPRERVDKLIKLGYTHIV